jgi:hypothetical protein
MATTPPQRAYQGPARKRRNRSFLVHHRRWVIVAGIACAGAALYYYKRSQAPAVHELTGYVAEVEPLLTQYAHFQGKPLKALDVQQQFEQAAAEVGKGRYHEAADLLQSMVRQAPVPVIFNNLGVLYAELNDRARAVNAFREALARDAGYAPVRRNMERLKGFTSNIANPVSEELEPNNSLNLANLMTVNRPVDAEIHDMADSDYFRITTPPAPRDRLEFTLANRSNTLAPRLRMYDEEGVILPFMKDTHTPGESLTFVLAPPPNTTYHFEVYGDRATFGAYTFSVKTLKSFDSFEPNDDIYSATKITVGTQVDAAIMDDEDTDYYSFVSPRTGTLAIEIRNRSETLIPALSTFSPDMRTSGFGPDVDRAGGSLHHTIQAQEGLTYFIQVWSQAKTAGEYSLRIE